MVMAWVRQNDKTKKKKIHEITRNICTDVMSMNFQNNTNIGTTTTSKMKAYTEPSAVTEK